MMTFSSAHYSPSWPGLFRPSRSFLLRLQQDADARDKPGMTSSGTHRLDIVAVGIEQERRVIGRAVVGAGTCAAIVAAAGFQALGVEAFYRGMVGRAEGDMGAGSVGVL